LKDSSGLAMLAQFSSRHVWLWLLGATGLAAWLTFGVLPRHREIAKLRAEIRSLDRLERGQTTHLQKLAEIEQSLARAKELLSSPRVGAPTSSEKDGLFTTVAEIAQKTGIILTRFSPREAQEASRGKAAEGVYISCLGSFQQIARFLLSLESPPFSFHVVELTWRKKQGNGEILEIEALCEN
jgi:Tfp pilus assembly protein PilO